MPTRITSLPNENMGRIHQILAGSASPPLTTAQTPSVQHHAPHISEQAARRAAAARANFAVVSHQFNEVDREILSLRENSAIGCLVTQNAIQNLAGGPAHAFEPSLRALFKKNANIGVDVATLSPENAATVLRILTETVQSDDGIPLHNVRFHADLDHASPALLSTIDDAINTIREARNGTNTAFEFACSSHDSARTTPPDFSQWANLRENLTSVDLSSCYFLTTAPDFSNSRKLTAVDLSECSGLTTTPDFSNNPNLTSVDMSWCTELAAAPDFSQNLALTSVNMTNCSHLRVAPDFSQNPSLMSVNLSGCDDLRVAPDFSNNRNLTSVNMSECFNLAAAPDFSRNPAVTSINLSWCSNLSAAPDFSQNPALTSINLTGCSSLSAAPDFSRNPNLTRVGVRNSGLPAASIAALRSLLGNRLAA